MGYESEIGLHKDELDTPALLLDLPTMKRNLRRMADFFAGKTVKLRPHMKTFNAQPIIGRMQLEAGAIGLTCAKLSEAEVLVDAEVKDILIANQIVGPRKITRLVKLAGQAEMTVAVDHPDNVRSLSEAAESGGVSIGILVEVNIGHNRCGVAPFEPTLDLVKQVVESPGLHFKGLMGYDGHCTLKIEESERRPLSLKANSLLVQASKYIQDAGYPVEKVSASGTFTYRFASEIDGITEIQAGTYLVNDTAFKEHGVREFDCALSVMTTIISRPTYPEEDGLAIIDAGRKSISPLLGLPEVKCPEGATVFSLSQEHGRVRLEENAAELTVGDNIELWVRDANGTINQFDRFYVMRDNIVEDIWEIPLCGIST
jgi:D-serine deaminase-like pyridoxal phosphate-dependent protein